jgi:hypothetical protein
MKINVVIYIEIERCYGKILDFKIFRFTEEVKKRKLFVMLSGWKHTFFFDFMCISNHFFLCTVLF